MSQGTQVRAKCSAELYHCPPGRQWSVSPRGLQAIGQRERLTHGGNIQWKFYEDEIPGTARQCHLGKQWRVTDKQYVVETPPKGPRTLPPDDNGPRGPGAGPHLRLRSHALPGRDLGPPVDRHRRGTGLHRHRQGKTHHQHLSLSHAQGLPRGRQAGPRDGAGTPPTRGADTIRRRSPPTPTSTTPR